MDTELYTAFRTGDNTDESGAYCRCHEIAQCETRLLIHVAVGLRKLRDRRIGQHDQLTDQVVVADI